MGGSDPGERLTPGADAREDPAARRLARPPSARYAGGPEGAEPGGESPAAARSALPGPLARAGLIAVAGAAVLVVVGAILASTAGLLFVAGATGGAIGLVLARAAAPRDDGRPVSRRTATALAIGLAIAAVAVAGIATWVVARQEGGTLGLLDYLLTTFGPFVPGEGVLAAIAAAWGANAGPVQG